jgi:hypothetical protein
MTFFNSDENCTVNYSGDCFKLLQKKDFIVDDKTETIKLQSGDDIQHYNILSICNNNKPQLFTICLENVEMTFKKSKKEIILTIPFKENRYLFRFLMIIANVFKEHIKEEINGAFYQVKNKEYTMKLRMYQTIIFSKTGIEIQGGKLFELDNKKIFVRNITIRFFIFKSSNKFFYNSRAIKVDTDYILQDENINSFKDISLEDFTKLSITEKVKYYANHLKNYNDHQINDSYEWMGVYYPLNEKVEACNKQDINKLINDKIDFLVNTYLMPYKQTSKKHCRQYIDNKGSYHYLLTFLFRSDKHDTTPTIENQTKLGQVVEHYLSNRLIESLGFWYDQAQPPTNHIHFNIHSRSVLPLHYFRTLFDDWVKNHGQVLIAHSFDPLLLRLYLARNNQMFHNDKVEYRTDKQIFDEARMNFKNYLNTKDNNTLIDFLNNTFSNLPNLFLKDKYFFETNKDDFFNLPLDEDNKTTINIINISNNSNNINKVNNSTNSNTTFTNEKSETKEKHVYNTFDSMIKGLDEINKEQLQYLTIKGIDKLDKEQLEFVKNYVNMIIKNK